MQDFDCGTDEWCLDVNKWIKSDIGNCAISSIIDEDHWCKAWLYSNTELLSPASLVGYASLGLSDWPLLPGDRTREKVATIPYFGVNRGFRGQFHEPDETFATGMFRDLLSQANYHLPSEVRKIGLYVHPDNSGGIRFWERCGFVFLPHRVYNDRDSGIRYRGMIADFR